MLYLCVEFVRHGMSGRDVARAAVRERCLGPWFWPCYMISSERLPRKAVETRRNSEQVTTYPLCSSFSNVLITVNHAVQHSIVAPCLLTKIDDRKEVEGSREGVTEPDSGDGR